MEENSQQSPELRQEFVQKKKELLTLRSQLNEIHTQKESIFHQLRATRDKIRARSSQISKLKQERDSLTGEVKQLKNEREKLHVQVQEKSFVKKEVDEKQKQFQGPSTYQESPGQLKRQIDALERKIETEVMAFTKEQQLTKTLKEMRARYKEIQQKQQAKTAVLKEANTINADFSQVRREAHETHKLVQDKAQQSQQRHEQLTTLVEEIKALRVEEKPLEAKIKEYRTKMDELKKTLDENSKRVDELAKLFQEEEQKSFKDRAKEKTVEVQEKLKKGKKLTTEDILAFQALKD